MQSKAVLRLLAFDLGAESGRAMLGNFDGERLELHEVHRFSTIPVRVGEHLYSDVLNIWSQMQVGLQKAVAQSESGLASVGVDTWGVDFVLLDEKDNLLGNPYHYRDQKNLGTLPIALGRAPRGFIYEQTGNQLIEFNTLFQLLSLQREQHFSLDSARSFLMLPDLFNFWLCGQKISEYTIASTSQCFRLQERDWARDLLRKMEIRDDIFQPVVPPGSVIGELLPWLANQSGCNPFPVIAPACHDTGSAVAAVPVSEEHFMYISSGTWSLIGIELDQPLINDRALALNLANEGGVGNRVRVLKISTGMWLLQQCRNEFARSGQNYTYEELTSHAESVESFGPLIAVNGEDFIAPGDMPSRIRDYCRHTGQRQPETIDEIVRSILESLALEYRSCLEMFESLLGFSLPVIHIIGGGSQNILLNQLTADVTHRQVIAGPVEATVAGNILVQAMGLGYLSTLDDLRQVMRCSFEPQVYHPRPDDRWEESYQRYLGLVNGMGVS